MVDGCYTTNKDYSFADIVNTFACIGNEAKTRDEAHKGIIQFGQILGDQFGIDNDQVGLFAAHILDYQPIYGVTTPAQLREDLAQEMEDVVYSQPHSREVINSKNHIIPYSSDPLYQSLSGINRLRQYNAWALNPDFMSKISKFCDGMELNDSDLGLITYVPSWKKETDLLTTQFSDYLPKTWFTLSQFRKDLMRDPSMTVGDSMELKRYLSPWPRTETGSVKMTDSVQSYPALLKVIPYSILNSHLTNTPIINTKYEEEASKVPLLATGALFLNSSTGKLPTDYYLQTTQEKPISLNDLPQGTDLISATLLFLHQKARMSNPDGFMTDILGIMFTSYKMSQQIHEFGIHFSFDIPNKSTR